MTDSTSRDDSNRNPRGLGVALSLPSWTGSIRFRLAALYSVVLVTIAFVVFGGVYVVLAQTLADQPVSRTIDVAPFVDASGSSTTATITVGDPGSGVERSVPPAVEVKAREGVADLEREINSRTLTQLRAYSVGAFLVFFVTSLCVGWLVAAWVLKPIERITEVAQEIQATDLSKRIDLGGPDDELRHLADTFDEMLERIDETFASQRRFIQEVSHELRNPLATIRANLEVTLSDPAATIDDLRHTALIVDRSSERISKLVDDLLVTARNEIPELSLEPVEVSSIVLELAEEFAGPADARDLRVRGDAVEGLWVAGDRQALKQCLANLLANAIRLAPEGSTVRVAAGRRDRWVWMAVEDEGPGIAPADQERVFQRFWRNNPDDRDQGRNGLGLTIVRQIALAHRGQVGLVSSVGKGSTFSVRLPVGAPPEGRRPASSSSGGASEPSG